MKQWNKIFKQYGRSYNSSPKNMPKIAEFFRKNDVKRVLDLGCGTGGHIFYLVTRGFEVYGIDIAKEGIKIARQCLKDSKLRANLKVGSIYEKLRWCPYLFFRPLCSIFGHDIFPAPNVICNSRFHSGCNSKCLMYPHKVIMKEV